ncbi:MAG TPA: universal stress protein [Steroidobacteraceae bacterium]|nr:universal stress protein [Steroidobacteraceae bacterium]
MSGLHASELGASGAIFLGQIVVLLLTARLLGELLCRFGQPPVMGQLLAGVILGPSILGHIAPAAELALFPHAPAQRAMLDAVAQLGVLLLLLLTGMETREPASSGPSSSFHRAIARSAAGFSGPFAIVLARREHRSGRLRTPLNILVPVSGTAVSRRGAELAVALAQGSRGSVTALHIAGRAASRRSLRERLGLRFGRHDEIDDEPSSNPITNEIVQLARAYSVNVRSAVRSHREAETAILREIGAGRHDLVVMGVSQRPGDTLNFGEVASVLLERAECSLVFLAAEPAAKPELPANPK